MSEEVLFTIGAGVETGWKGLEVAGEGELFQGSWSMLVENTSNPSISLADDCLHVCVVL